MERRETSLAVASLGLVRPSRSRAIISREELNIGGTRRSGSAGLDLDVDGFAVVQIVKDGEVALQSQESDTDAVTPLIDASARGHAIGLRELEDEPVAAMRDSLAEQKV